MVLETSYSDLQLGLRRLAQTALVLALAGGVVWSFAGVAPAARATVVLHSVLVLLGVVGLAGAVRFSDVKLAQRTSFPRRTQISAIALALAAGIAAVARIFIDEAVTDAEARTVMLVGALGLFASLIWMYRYNNGLARPRNRAADDSSSVRPEP